MSNQWDYSVFGCFGDWRICCLSFCVPCYSIGKNAEALGEDCMLHGLLACIGLPFGPVIRWRLRQDRNIEGTMLMDVLLWTLLPCCALVQEARQIGWAMPDELNKMADKAERATKRDKNNDGVDNPEAMSRE